MYASFFELYYILPHGGLIIDQPISLEWYHTWKMMIAKQPLVFHGTPSLIAHILTHSHMFFLKCWHMFLGCNILVLMLLGCIPSYISIPYLLKTKFFLESRNPRNHSASTVVACQTSKPCDKAILNVGCKNYLSNNR